jgi:hypothetical protein
VLAVVSEHVVAHAARVAAETHGRSTSSAVL